MPHRPHYVGDYHEQHFGSCCKTIYSVVKVWGLVGDHHCSRQFIEPNTTFKRGIFVLFIFLAATVRRVRQEVCSWLQFDTLPLDSTKSLKLDL